MVRVCTSKYFILMLFYQQGYKIRYSCYQLISILLRGRRLGRVLRQKMAGLNSSSQSFVDVCNRELSQFTIFMAVKYFVLLGINDHGAVYSKVRSISARWKPFASSLCLSPNTINLIEANNNRDRESCMSKALEYWLRKDYNYSVYGVPCWRMVCVAVKEGGGDTALAEEIAREHPLPASRETTPSGQTILPGKSMGKFMKT